MEGGDAVVRCECAKARILDMRMHRLFNEFRAFEQVDLDALVPRDKLQADTLQLLRANPSSSYFICGARYGCGKTQLLVSQCMQLALAGERVAIRTSRQLVKELQQAELDPEFFSEILEAVSSADQFHLFWDDCEKVGNQSDFRQEAIFNLIDTIYRRRLSITITSNLDLQRLVDTGRMLSAVARRIDDMCKPIQL